MGFKRKGSQTSRNDVLPDLHIATASSVKGIAPTKNLASSPQHGKGRICREDLHRSCRKRRWPVQNCVLPICIQYHTSIQDISSHLALRMLTHENSCIYSNTSSPSRLVWRWSPIPLANAALQTSSNIYQGGFQPAPWWLQSAPLQHCHQHWVLPMLRPKAGSKSSVCFSFSKCWCEEARHLTYSISKQHDQTCIQLFKRCS